MAENTNNMMAYLEGVIEPFDHDIKKAIANLSIIDIGTITFLYDDGFCDVQSTRMCGDQFIKYNHAELVYPYGLGIAHINDLCIILNPVVTMPSLKDATIDMTAAPYSTTGAKIIPIVHKALKNVNVGTTMSGTFIAEGDGVSLSVSGSIVRIQAAGNEYSWDSDGNIVQTTAGGLVDTTTGGNELKYNLYMQESEDSEPILLFSFYIDSTGGVYITQTEDSSRTVQINVGDNKITVDDNDDAKGVTVEDANGNTVVTSEDGIEVTDANGNSFTMNSDGIVEQTNSDALLEIGNQVATLGGLLQELAQDLISASTVGSSSTHTMDPGTQANLQSWMQKMQQVFS